MIRYGVAIFALLCALGTLTGVAQNLVSNGGFEEGKDTPAHWHVRLADFFVQKRPDDAQEGEFVYRHVCGCGFNYGPVQPWAGLTCPSCQGFVIGEATGAEYRNNHQYVSLVPGPSGRALMFNAPASVMNNQGVRVMTEPIVVRRGWGYKFSFDCRVEGSLARAFVEGFQYVKEDEQDAEVRKQIDPDGKAPKLKRVYRSAVNTQWRNPTQWQRFSVEFVAPQRYQFDVVIIKLFAQNPGRAWFDNVYLARMTEQELNRFLANERPPKDKRFAR